ncbi:uncharacterized protein BJX67DRAFT_359137 [Aspergillus lucknowensis]|uniref:Uncharacterized protein n=1 Tax=Aspergillus lucknowensis TaxID=176173 RepID=A0ABR4LL55_9EURO
MAWSIDTSISFIALLITGTSSLLVIWNYAAHLYRRAFPQGLSLRTDGSIARAQQRPRDLDLVIRLESGPWAEVDRMQPVRRFLSKFLSQAVCRLTTTGSRVGIAGGSQDKVGVTSGSLDAPSSWSLVVFAFPGVGPRVSLANARRERRCQTRIFMRFCRSSKD